MTTNVTLVSVAGFAGSSVSSVTLGGDSSAVPGLYYIDFRDAAGASVSTAFFVDPLFSEFGEVVSCANTPCRLRRGKFFAGTLTLCNMPGSRALFEGPDYSVDSSTGELFLTQERGSSDSLVADYRYPGETTGPWPLDSCAIPGVVLTFGQVVAGDLVAVLVESPS